MQAPGWPVLPKRDAWPVGIRRRLCRSGTRMRQTHSCCPSTGSWHFRRTARTRHNQVIRVHCDGAVRINRPSHRSPRERNDVFRDVRLSPLRFLAGPRDLCLGRRLGSRRRSAAAFAIPRETLMFREMEELCYPPIAEAKAIPTGTVKLRLALARQPLEPARTEVRLVEVGPGKRNGALVTRRFAIRHRLRRVLR